MRFRFSSAFEPMRAPSKHHFNVFRFLRRQRQDGCMRSASQGYDAAAMSARTWVAIELAAIAVAALLFVATVRVRPPYLDLALAAAAVALIALSARRSTRLWHGTASTAQEPDARAAWLASGAFTAAALLALAALATLGTFNTGDSTMLERAHNWHVLIAVALYFPWA